MNPADAIVFPPSLLREQGSRWRPVGGLVAGGGTGDNRFPVERLDGGPSWACDLLNIQLRTQDHIRTWRAIEALAEGGVMPVVVPMCDKRHGPFPTVDGAKVYSQESVPHSDGSFFSDGSGYSQSVIDIVAAASALLRATEITMQVNVGDTPQSGQYFSLWHEGEGWRLHLIKTVDDSGADPVVTFTPPLREAVAAGQYIEFDEPRCTMRLASSEAMSMQLDMRKTGAPSASFVEYLFNA